MIDTHCHLYSEELMPDVESVISDAKKVGISHILMPNIDSTSIEMMLSLEKASEICYSMMGLHPCYVKENYKNELQILDDWFEKRLFYGVGETGIDLYWDKTFYAEQIIAFDYQIDIAIAHHLPIIIHSRESLDVTIKMIEKKQHGNLKGIFHCFNGSIEQAERIKSVGFHIGLGGVITYKNANMSEIIQQNGLSNVVLETDAPYLSPIPNRGKRNEPAFLKHVLDKLSEIMGQNPEEVESITNENAKKLFNTHTNII